MPEPVEIEPLDDETRRIFERAGALSALLAQATGSHQGGRTGEDPASGGDNEASPSVRGNGGVSPGAFRLEAAVSPGAGSTNALAVGVGGAPGSFPGEEQGASTDGGALAASPGAATPLGPVLLRAGAPSPTPRTGAGAGGGLFPPPPDRASQTPPGRAAMAAGLGSQTGGHATPASASAAAVSARVPSPLPSSLASRGLPTPSPLPSSLTPHGLPTPAALASSPPASASRQALLALRGQLDRADATRAAEAAAAARGSRRAWQRPLSDFPASEHVRLARRTVLEAVNVERAALGEAPVLAAQLYRLAARPAWWPSPDWSRSQTATVANARSAYEAARRFLSDALGLGLDDEAE